MQLLYIVSLLLPLVIAQQYTTPVPILKQINKHNEDGSYSYGYEGADGTFKIETKYPNGEVYGKYGYIDDLGKLREVEYGATRRGFEPAGQEINVAPPTLKNTQEPLRPLGQNEEDDGQYREDPSLYYKNDPYNSENTNAYDNRPSYQSFQSQNYNNYQQQPVYTNTQNQNYQQPSYQQPSYQQPSYQQPSYQQQSYQPAYKPQPSYQQPAFRPHTQYSFNSQPQPSQPHPATGVDYNSGSYSVSY